MWLLFCCSDFLNVNVVSSQIYFILWRENGLWLAVDPEHFWYKGECLPLCTAPNITRKLILISFPSSHKHDLRYKGRDLDTIASVRRYKAAEWRWEFLRSCLWPQGKDMKTNLLVLLGACAIPLSRSGGMSAACSVSWWAQSDQGFLLVFAEEKDLYLPYSHEAWQLWEDMILKCQL